MAAEEAIVLTIRHPSDPRRLPPIIAVCLAIDILLSLLHLVVVLSPEVSWKLTDMFHLEHESNLPTWYSSLQLFTVGVLLALFARSRFDRRSRRSWALVLLAGVFVALSIDEATQFHEWFATKIDQWVLPTGDRADTMLWFTGVWIFVLGLPALVLMVGLIRYARVYFVARPQVASKMITGVCLLLAGAAGVEGLANFMPVDSIAHVLQVFFEEFLEMVGVTVILWAVVDLLHACGLALHLSSTDGSKPDTFRR